MLIHPCQFAMIFCFQYSYFHNVYLSLLLYHGDLRESCQKMFEMECQSGMILYATSAHKFILGLAAFRLYRKTCDFVWAERGRACIHRLKVWNEEGSTWNFEQKLKMMEAEENFCLGNFEGAKTSYQDAISAARVHKNLSDEALACELAAKFYFKIGDLESSFKHYRLAHEVYSKYGASGKANKLFTYISEKFSSVLASDRG